MGKGDKKMFAVHFFENKTRVFNLASRTVPTVGEELKIKGRKGKVISIEQIEENVFYVYVEFEKIVDKSKTVIKDLGKKKRR